MQKLTAEDVTNKFFCQHQTAEHSSGENKKKKKQKIRNRRNLMETEIQKFHQSEAIHLVEIITFDKIKP